MLNHIFINENLFYSSAPWCCESTQENQWQNCSDSFNNDTKIDDITVKSILVSWAIFYFDNFVCTKLNAWLKCFLSMLYQSILFINYFVSGQGE